jgi:lactonase
MTVRHLLFAALVAVANVSPAFAAAQVVQQPPAEAGGPVPVPPAELALRTVIATGAIPVTGAKQDLEGAFFDRAGNVIFSDAQGGRVLRLDPAGRISVLATLAGLMPGGMALAPDGRIFIASQTGKDKGTIVAMFQDGSGLQTIVAETAGFAPNDLVFDAKGGFYFTDARGNAGELSGGVYYVDANGSQPRPVLVHLAVANGVALSPDDKILWVGEFGMGRLHRLGLDGATNLKPFAATVAYHFIGPAPDSMRADADGNIYVALYGQGRILVFSASGMPIGQILLPGREHGRHLNLTSMAIQPGSRDMVIVTSDGAAGTGTIFHAQAFGLGLQRVTCR